MDCRLNQKIRSTYLGTIKNKIDKGFRGLQFNLFTTEQSLPLFNCCNYVTVKSYSCY